MAFGTFDGIHEGHRSFLRQARQQGDRLIVAVAHDHAVEQLKQQGSDYSLSERISMIETEAIADVVVAGDIELGSWEVLQRHAPDVIALGYDQSGLRAALEAMIGRLEQPPVLMIMEAFKPEELHSSIIRMRPTPLDPQYVQTEQRDQLLAE